MGLVQLLSAVLCQALVRGDAEADKELCARAMGAVYSAHAATIGALPSHRLRLLFSPSAMNQSWQY